VPSKNFSLFNALRWGGQEWPGFTTPNMFIVPVVVKRQFATEVAQSALDLLKANGSLAAPGFMDPEGIVIHVPDVNGRWKMTFDGDKHKSETG
jgi:phage tail protein X